MIADLRTRGPDGSGAFSERGVHLAHTRLAIIDLASGGQPMAGPGPDDRWVVIYNGEIYNYDKIRRDLEALGYRFHGHCDTELLPAGFAAWGPDLFRRLIGMFAMVVFDRTTGLVVLARDHIGIKPLFYSQVGGNLVFASTGKAVARHPHVGRRLRPGAVRDFLQFRYVRSGCHLFEGVESLPPGSWAEWTEGRLTIHSFWRMPRLGEAPPLSDADTIDRVGELLSQSVRWQLRSDVPLAIFLSGGLDSSTIATLARQHGGKGLTAITYAIAGEEGETQAAAETARTLGMIHQVVEGPPGLDGLAEAVAALDSPVGDAIILPTYQLCEAAARSCKVALSGEGADEVFGGYAHFPVLVKLARLSRHAPWLSKVAPLVRAVPVSVLDRFFSYQASLGRLGRDRVAELVAALGRDGDLLALSGAVVGDAALTAGTNLPPPPPRPEVLLSLGEALHDFATTWLPHQILAKTDQLSMAHGLEVRVPYADFRLFETMAGAAEHMILAGGTNKITLRAAAEQAGVTLARRPKAAFYLPVEQSHRADLLRLADQWLSPERLARHGILRREFVKATRSMVMAGEFLAGKRLTAMIVLHMWIESHDASLGG